MQSGEAQTTIGYRLVRDVKTRGSIETDINHATCSHSHTRSVQHRAAFVETSSAACSMPGDCESSNCNDQNEGRDNFLSKQIHVRHSRSRLILKFHSLTGVHVLGRVPQLWQTDSENSRQQANWL